MSESKYFQDHMPGNVCFGCGRDNHEGLRISSYWDDGEGICIWEPEEKYQGWHGLVNGGILATLVDCHCMCTSMAHAVRRENRSMDTSPFYRFATGQMKIRFLKPTPSDRPVEVRAKVVDIKDERKYTLEAEVWSGGKDGGEKVVEAEVISFLVFSSDNPDHGESPFGG